MKTINVKSVDDYFSLPKNEREYFGLYKKPFMLPWEHIGIGVEKGWDHFYDHIRKEYPIQYFIREWIPSMDNPLIYAYKKYISCPIREMKYTLSNFISPCFPRWRKVLPRHKYSDIANVMVESNLALICDFYHEEVIDGNIDWGHNEEHKKFYTELVENVNWIEHERHKIDRMMREALTEAVKNKIKKNEKNDYFETYADYNNLEKHKIDKETEIIKWFIDNRDFFWT
jgi:hypothetical protein